MFKYPSKNWLSFGDELIVLTVAFVIPLVSLPALIN